MKGYNKRTWLNPIGDPSNGNIVTFQGEVKNYSGEKEINTFLSLSNCNVSARLHKTKDQTDTDFINKLFLIKKDIDSFINFLSYDLLDFTYLWVQGFGWENTVFGPEDFDKVEIISIDKKEGYIFLAYDYEKDKIYKLKGNLKECEKN